MVSISFIIWLIVCLVAFIAIMLYIILRCRALMLSYIEERLVNHMSEQLDVCSNELQVIAKKIMYLKQ